MPRDDSQLEKLRAQIELALYVEPKLQLASWDIGARWSTLSALVTAINAPICSNCTRCDLLNVSRLFVELFPGIRNMQVPDVVWCRRCGQVSYLRRGAHDACPVSGLWTERRW